MLLLEFLQLKRPVSLGGETGLFCLWVCGLAKVVCSGGYFEFLMRRAAAVVIPSPMAAIPASAIALGAVSLPVAGEATGGVASAGCVEPEGGVVSVGCVISGEGALSAAAFASSYALQASS